MSHEQKITFEAVVEQNENMDAAFVRFPFNVEELFGVKGQVKVNVVKGPHPALYS